MNNIRLEQLNRAEALRYMGYNNSQGSVDEKVSFLLDKCEAKVLETSRPAYIYKVFDIESLPEGIGLAGTKLVLTGESIRTHLKDCRKAVLMAVTVSLDVDRLIRVTQLSDMAEAVMVDSFASVAVEQVCDKVEQMIVRDFPTMFTTYRYGVGYGDLPIAIQKDFVNVLNAHKLIGLSVTESGMLVPTKSVTAVIGLSEKPIEKGMRGCITCNMKEVCQFRKKGGHCNE